MSAANLVVLKFGSSVLRGEADLPRVTAEIARHVSDGSRVVAVVSAIGRSTEALIGRARALGFDPDRGPNARGPAGTSPRGFPRPSGEPVEEAFAALLATGEATSAAILGLALDRAGVASTVLCPGRVGPFTRGPRFNAEPHAFDAGAVKRALARRPVAILPGFVGRDDEGFFTLLGRGGSDLSALFVAHSLAADRCCLLKDVDGIYEHDPASKERPRPRRYASLDWDACLRLDDRVIQRKAAQFAYRHRVAFEVGACGAAERTRVGAAMVAISAREVGR